MKGRVYAYGEPCPCGGTWKDVKDGVTGDTINIICGKCYRSPVRFAIDGRSFKTRRGSVGRVFRDKKGDLYYAFHTAYQDLQAIRAAWRSDGPERFNPSKYSVQRQSYKLVECAREWQLHLKEKGASRGYQTHVELFFRLHLLPNLPQDIDIREVVPDDIEKLSLALKTKGLSQNSVKSALTVLRTLFKRYHYRKMVLDQLIPWPEKWSEVPDIDRETLTPEKQDKIISLFPERERLMLEIYADLGCRPSELVGLKRRDFLPGYRVEIQRVINAYGKMVEQTKNRKKRLADLRPDLHDRVCAMPLLPEAFVFVQEDGKPYNPNALSSMFRIRADAAGFPGTTLYTFSRHSLATRVKRDAERKAKEESARRIGNTLSVASRHYIMPNNND